MVGVIDYLPLSPDETDLRPLSDEAWRDGYPFVERMLHDWNAGIDRFDDDGARLVGAFEGDELVGFGGLNRDPYTTENVGRVRLLYVTRPHRGEGVATSLFGHLLDGASIWFPRLRVRSTPGAASFYEHLGFAPVDEPDATHALPLRPSPGV